LLIKKGMEEGLKKGKELGREGAMGEVAAQFKWFTTVGSDMDGSRL
jgi:hypothetical protein